MGTNTIPGYEAEPAEIQALTEQIIAEILESMADEHDPLVRYTMLCAEQVRQDALRCAVVAAIVRLRGVELRGMATPGVTYDQIAKATRLGTRQRVYQLIAPAT